MNEVRIYGSFVHGTMPLYALVAQLDRVDPS